MSMTEAQQHWEERYGERDRIWSGRVNARLEEVAADLPPGRALDLGCGEGGDAVWLAGRGWTVVAVDISETALARARQAAGERDVLERIDFQHHDLSDSFPAGTYDLVSAQFLHSLVRLEREQILRNAAAAVAPGGRLLIVDHGGAPPWADEHVREHHFPSARDVVAGLELDAAEWDRVRVDTVERSAVGPDGQSATLVDNVMVLRRRTEG
ncbi:MAG: class I SAM-dependent methyltransferase [Actinobacteria bacterium]|nr:class I SAM-dependent methyltransferase [Actinomycetota bacterium]